MAVAVVTVVAVIGLGGAVGSGAGAATGVDGQLTSVQIGNDGSFDRVVFVFEGTAVPTVQLAGPSPNPGSVHGDPSDRLIPVLGAQLVQIAMTGAMAHGAANPTGAFYTGPTDFHPTDTANIEEVVMTGDFEATLSWAIGVRVGTTPRVSSLTDPVRIVVDIPHGPSAATVPSTTAVPPSPTSGTPSFTG